MAIPLPGATAAPTNAKAYTAEVLAAAAIAEALDVRQQDVEKHAAHLAREKEMFVKILSDKLTSVLHLTAAVIDLNAAQPQCFIPWAQGEITLTAAPSGRGPTLWAAVACPRCSDPITRTLHNAADLGELLIAAQDYTPGGRANPVILDHCRLYDTPTGQRYISHASAPEPEPAAKQVAEAFEVTDVERQLLVALRSYLDGQL